MVVIPSAVEPHQTEPHQFFDLGRCRVDHPNNRFSFAFDLPVYKEQIRENLNIVKDELCLIISCGFRRTFRFELHFVYQLDAIIGFVRALCSKSQNIRTHVRHIIAYTACVSVFQRLINEINAGFCCGMVFLIEIALDDRSKPFLVFYPVKIYHLIFSFQR